MEPRLDESPQPSEDHTIRRRDFLRICTLAAASIGLPGGVGKMFAETVETKRKPSVIWLHFQECTGCTESLLRPDHPALDELILDLISLDYHETLLVPSGHQAEECRHKAMEENAGAYVLVVEGAIPTKDNGIYCKVGGMTALDMLKETAEKAGAIIAIGSCASWGGIPSALPDPTGAKGVAEILEGKTVVSLPGCPANPYNLLGTVLQYATFGTLPKLDGLGRPLHSYGQTIHEHCPRRGHFDAGRFALEYGDEGHREGYCLYKLGCKGPATHANCSTMHFGEVVGAWPIGIGHPCFGCTEEQLAFKVPLHDTVDIERPTPPDTYPPINAPQGSVGAVATGVAGLAAGAVVGASWAAARKLDDGSDSGGETS